MEQTEEIKVYGMMCGHCTAAVKKAVESLSGVSACSPDLEKKSARVTFDSTKTSVAEIANIIVSEGYSLSDDSAGDDETVVTDDSPPENAVVSKFDVTGMSCVNCAASVERALSDTEGIRSASVNFAIERLTVEHDPSVTPEGIAELVNNAGFTAVHHSDFRTVSFRVDGMSCANCSGTLEKALRKTDGIREATVNFAAEKASVNFDTRLTDEDDIYAIVRESGFTPLADQEKKASPAARKERFRFFFALVFTVPVFLLMHFSPLGESRHKLHHVWSCLACAVCFGQNLLRGGLALPEKPLDQYGCPHISGDIRSLFLQRISALLYRQFGPHLF